MENLFRHTEDVSDRRKHLPCGGKHLRNSGIKLCNNGKLHQCIETERRNAGLHLPFFGMDLLAND